MTQYISASGNMTALDIACRLQKEIQNQREFGAQYWPIFCLKDDSFIGCCGFRPYKQEPSVFEMGFHLRPVYWGKGVATEAAQATIAYAFDTLKAYDLIAGHHPKNLASAKLLRKLGFHYTQDEFYEPTGLEHPTYRYIGPGLPS